MTEGHTLIDRKGEVDKGKETMIRGWIGFFKSFPDYKNTFERVESQGDLVVLMVTPRGSRALIQIARYGQQ